MFLNSVILILQETLEAALLVSVLLVFSKLHSIKPLWLISGIVLGVLGAFIFAINMAQVSEWFDYVGQEIANALLQFAILVFIVFFLAVLPKDIQLFGRSTDKKSNNAAIKRRSIRWCTTCMLLMVALALTREGSEIFLYIGGVISQPSHIQPTLAGAVIGFGLGISAGVLIYYGLLVLPPQRIAASGVLLLALVAGNMASQATLLLTQADWLPFSRIMWNSTEILPENSILGHLLYALIGYEATPSLFQVIGYIGGFIMVYFCQLIAHLISKQKLSQQNKVKI
jgi:high-affinity iron transporter